MKRLYLVTLHDKTQYEGEYVGAQDGFIYLATADEVSRVDQTKVAAMIVIERRSADDE